MEGQVPSQEQSDRLVFGQFIGIVKEGDIERPAYDWPYLKIPADRVLNCQGLYSTLPCAKKYSGQNDDRSFETRLHRRYP